MSIASQMQVTRNAMIGIGVGAAGAAFIGYLIYFDHKRRTAPDFKKKLREKRAASRANKQEKSKRKMPEFSDPSEMQAYFLQEVQLGEELLSEGDFEGAVEHLSSAVLLCGQPAHLLQILRQTLPPQVFAMLIEKLPTKKPDTAESSGGATVTEVDADLE